MKLVEKLAPVMPFCNVLRYWNKEGEKDKDSFIKFFAKTLAYYFYSMAAVAYAITSVCTGSLNPIKQNQIINDIANERKEMHDYCWKAVRVAADMDGNDKLDYVEEREMYARLGVEKGEKPSLSNIEKALAVYTAENDKILETS